MGADLFGLGNRKGHRSGPEVDANLDKENRALNVRLAEITDVVTELLLPVAARDEEKLEELLGKYRGDFS